MNDGKAEDRAGGSAYDFRIKRADGTFAEHDTGAAEGFRGAEDGTQIAGILQTGQDDDRAYLKAFGDVVERKFFEAYQRGYALRGFARNQGVE